MNSLPTQAKLKKVMHGLTDLTPDEMGWKSEVDLWQMAIYGQEQPEVAHPTEVDEQGRPRQVTLQEARRLSLPGLEPDITKMTNQGNDLPPEFVPFDALITYNGRFTMVSRLP